jgi:hypothetical protein
MYDTKLATLGLLKEGYRAVKTDDESDREDGGRR